MEYDNTNRGTLGKNHNKKGDSHPDYSGQLNVDGVDSWTLLAILRLLCLHSH